MYKYYKCTDVASYGTEIPLYYRCSESSIEYFHREFRQWMLSLKFDYPLAEYDKKYFVPVSSVQVFADIL